VPNKLQEGGGGVGGTYLIPAHPQPISHSLLHCLLSISFHIHPTMPQEGAGTSCVFSRWLSGEQENART
jgi:hypothetical protein